MAFNDDIPRGWTLTNAAAAPAAAIVTVPAITGISHVLDAVYFKGYNASASGGPTTIVVNSNLGTFNNLQIGQIAVAAAGTDEIDLTDLGLQMMPGESFYVSTAIVWTDQLVVIQGHDV